MKSKDDTKAKQNNDFFCQGGSIFLLVFFLFSSFMYAKEAKSTAKDHNIQRVKVASKCRRYIHDQIRDSARPCRQKFKKEMRLAKKNKHSRWQARRGLTLCLHKANEHRRERVQKCINLELKKRSQ